MYQSTDDIFSATEAGASSPITFPTLIDNALVGLGTLISDSQNFESNHFAETILDSGLRALGPSADSDLQSPLYLRMYEQMIQGIIEDKVCPVNYFVPFLLLIVCHLTDDLPSVNLFDTSQCPILLQSHGDWAIVRSSSYDHRERWWLCVSSFQHPSHPRPVIYDEDIDEEEQVPDEWMHKVSVRPTTVRSFNLRYLSC